MDNQLQNRLAVKSYIRAIKQDIKNSLFHESDLRKIKKIYENPPSQNHFNEAVQSHKKIMDQEVKMLLKMAGKMKSLLQDEEPPKIDSLVKNLMTAEDVSEALRVSVSAVNKYSSALEKRGYEFERGYRNERYFSTDDLKNLDNLNDLIATKQFDLTEASSMIPLSEDAKKHLGKFRTYAKHTKSGGAMLKQ